MKKNLGIFFFFSSPENCFPLTWNNFRSPELFSTFGVTHGILFVLKNHFHSVREIFPQNILCWNIFHVWKYFFQIVLQKYFSQEKNVIFLLFHTETFSFLLKEKKVKIYFIYFALLKEKSLLHWWISFLSGKISVSHVKKWKFSQNCLPPRCHVTFIFHSVSHMKTLLLPWKLFYTHCHK